VLGLGNINALILLQWELHGNYQLSRGHYNANAYALIHIPTVHTVETGDEFNQK
jgi:hypothetical protein